MRKACRRISSSSEIPEPKRKVWEHRPPIERAANSMTHTPESLMRSSPWTGPSRSPNATWQPLEGCWQSVPEFQEIVERV